MLPLDWFIRGDPALLDMPFMAFMAPFMFWFDIEAIMFALGMLFIPIPCVRLLDILSCCC